MNAFKTALVLSLTMTVFGCTWVKPTERGAAVQVSTALAVAGCERLGKVNVSVKDRIGRVNRKEAKVESELETLARNEGAVMDGNTVVAESEVEDGRQEFGVYRCGSN